MRSTHAHTPHAATPASPPAPAAAPTPVNAPAPVNMATPYTPAEPPVAPAYPVAQPRVPAQDPRAVQHAVAVSTFAQDGGDSLMGRISSRVGGHGPAKRLLVASFAFLVLFAVLFVVKTLYDRAHYTSQAQTVFGQQVRGAAQSTARSIDSHIAQMGMALAFSRDPETVVDLARRSDTVRGVAVLDSGGTVRAETPGAGAALAQINVENMADGQTRIASLIQTDGETTPVIAMRSQGLYLLSALTPGALVGTDETSRALLWTNGRIIDGAPGIARVGSAEFYGVSSADLSAAVRVPGGEFVPVKLDGEPAWLGMAAVPGSENTLLVVDRRSRALPGFVRNNAVLFGTMFLGLVWLIWMLMSQLLRQLDAVRDSRERDEISQQRYQAAVDNSGSGVWEIDLTHNTAYLSASLARLFGVSDRDASISLPQFLGLFEGHDRDRLYNAIRRAHVNGAFDLDLSLAQLPLSVSCRGKPSTRGSDNAKVIVGMAIDVTEMRGTQVRLQAAEARLFDALRGMNDSFVIWDQMDRLVLWNRKFEEFFGFEPGNLQAGMEYAVVSHYADQVIAGERVLEDGTGKELNLTDGRWLRYLETRTQDGGRVSIGTEVTTIRAREAELEANRDRLEETIDVLRASQGRIVELAESYEQEKIRAEQASQSKSEFLANMSHELRTPLNAINGFSDIMKKEMFGPLGDPRYREYVSDILFSGQHLLSLINDILDMSKIEAGKMTLNVETLSIDQMIQQVLRIVRGRADENRLKLHYTPAEAQDIEADPRAVKQVLLNLATNAIKFTPEGGSVTVQVDPRATGLIVHVIDTGIGISEADIARLAQPFEQIDSQHSRQHEGTGLGLALSKSLVELHGGNFGITSELGKGTTVTFTLPNTPIAQAALRSENEVGDEISKLAEDIANVLERDTPDQRPNEAAA